MPSWKCTQRRRRHPSRLNYSPRRNVFRRGQKTKERYRQTDWQTDRQTDLPDSNFWRSHEDSVWGFTSKVTMVTNWAIVFPWETNTKLLYDMRNGCDNRSLSSSLRGERVKRWMGMNQLCPTLRRSQLNSQPYAIFEVGIADKSHHACEVENVPGEH